MAPKKKVVESNAPTKKAITATASKAILAEKAASDTSRRTQLQHYATLLSGSSLPTSGHVKFSRVTDSSDDELNWRKPSASEKPRVEIMETLQWLHAAYSPLAAWRALHGHFNSFNPFDEVALVEGENAKASERAGALVPKDSDVFILEPKSGMTTEGTTDTVGTSALFLRLVDAAWVEAFPQPNLELEKYRKRVRTRLATEVESYFLSIRRAKAVKSTDSKANSSYKPTSRGNGNGNGLASSGLDDETIHSLPWQYRYPLPTFSGSHLAAQCHRIQMWVQTWLSAPSESSSDSDSSSSDDSDSSDSETSSSSSNSTKSSGGKSGAVITPTVDYVQEEQQLKDAVAAVGSMSSDLLADGWDFNCIPAGGAFFNAQGQRVSARMLRREQQLREEEREREKEMRKVKGYLAGAEPVSGSCSNFIVIQGGSGVGKTAAVYKVAEEMHCKVVEINPSIRRSAKFLEEAFAEATQAKTLRLNGSNLKVQHELSLIKGAAPKPKPHSTTGGDSAVTKGVSEGGQKDGVVVAASGDAPKESKPIAAEKQQPRKKPNVISKEAIAKFFAPRKPVPVAPATTVLPQPNVVVELDAEEVHDVDGGSVLPVAATKQPPQRAALPSTIEIDLAAPPNHSTGNKEAIDVERSPSVGLIESTLSTVGQRQSSDSVALLSSTAIPKAFPGGVVTNTAISSTGTIVLIEAGDVVFDDEPGLYAAIKRIAVASKVPVIITATDFTEDNVHNIFGSDVPMISVEPPTHRLFLYLQLAAIVMANYIELMGGDNAVAGAEGSDRAPLSSTSFRKLVRSVGNLLFPEGVNGAGAKVPSSLDPTANLCHILKRFLDQVGDADVRKVLAALQYRLLPWSLAHSRKRDRHSDSEDAEEANPIVEPGRRVVSCFGAPAHLCHRQTILCFLQRSVTVERHRHLLQEVERFDLELWEEEQAADAAQQATTNAAPAGAAVVSSDSKPPGASSNEGTRSSGSGTPSHVGTSTSLFRTLFLNAQGSSTAKKPKGSAQDSPAFVAKANQLAPVVETPFTELFSPNHEAYLDPTTIQTRKMIEAEDDDEDDKRVAFLEYAKSRKKLKVPNFTRSTEFLCDFLCHGRQGSATTRTGNSPTTDSRRSPINVLAE